MQRVSGICCEVHEHAQGKPSRQSKTGFTSTLLTLAQTVNTFYYDSVGRAYKDHLEFDFQFEIAAHTAVYQCTHHTYPNSQQA